MSDRLSTAPDVSEMSAVHRVFRLGFERGPRLIASVGEGGSERVSTVASYFRNLLEFLHVHHVSEDELVFPRLRERTDQTAGIEALESQHEEVAAAATQARAALERWASTASPADGEAFSSTWDALGAIVCAHMDYEEAFALPLIEHHLTLEEWQELPRHAMSSFGGDDIFLIMGLVRDQMTQAQRDRMLEGMPRAAADAWRDFGVTVYARTVSDLTSGRP